MASLKFGDYNDNEAIFEIACRDAERGEKDEAVATITDLIVWIEQHPTDTKSHTWLLPRAYQAILLLEREKQMDKNTRPVLRLRADKEGNLISAEWVSKSGRVIRKLYPRG